MRISIAVVTCLVASTALFTSITFAIEKLRISYASVTGNTAGITYIAQRAGLFEKQGLDVEIILITGGPESISSHPASSLFHLPAVGGNEPGLADIYRLPHGQRPAARGMAVPECQAAHVDGNGEKHRERARPGAIRYSA